MNTPNGEVVKVKSSSNVQKVAGCVAGCVEKGVRDIEIRAIGAGAVNQAVKSVAVARGFLSPKGIDIVVVPGFGTVTDDSYDDDKKRTMVVLKVKVS